MNKRFCVMIDEKLLEKFDKAWKEDLCKTRTEALTYLIKRYINEVNDMQESYSEGLPFEM